MKRVQRKKQHKNSAVRKKQQYEISTAREKSNIKKV